MHNVITKMVDVECAKCNLLFSMTNDFKNRRQDDHGNFYCPKGHVNYWSQESDYEKLEKQVSIFKERYNRERIEREFNERSARSYKGKIKAIKTRISNGVCPCCNRTFKDMARHMENKHPGYCKEY